MNVLVPNENRFLRLQDGSVWVAQTSTYSFWERYLDGFDAIRVLVRVRDTHSVPEGYLRADGPGVSFVPLPYYQGPAEYVIRRHHIMRAARRGVERDEAIILRVPGQAAAIVHKGIEQNRPYGAEVVGDPYDVFTAGAIQHPLRLVFRWMFTRGLRNIVQGAAAVSYVTGSALQRRYPGAPHAFTTSYSSIDLRPEGYAQEGRSYSSPLSPARLLFVGSLEQMYKAPDVVIRALAELLNQGCDVTLRMVGDGRHRAELQRLAEELGVSRRIDFIGQLSSAAAVREQLDEADLFVLPSRTEGLPRAMIEAMARGLPAVGSTVGGIPELLPPEDMVAPGHADALAMKLKEVLADPRRMTRMSSRNLDRAQAYRSDVLRGRRAAFYRSVREQTQDWLDRGGVAN